MNAPLNVNTQGNQPTQLAVTENWQHQSSATYINTHADCFELAQNLLQKGTFNNVLRLMTYELVCSALLTVAQARDAKGQNWAQVVQFYDRDGKLHELVIPRASLAGRFIKELENRGLVIYNRKLLKEFLTVARHPDRALLVDKTGWNGDVFVLPNNMVFGPSTEPVILQNANNSLLSVYQVSGSLEDWQLNVATPCAGNSRLMFVLAAAFAGPFIRLLGMGNVGFHLMGKTSQGKSTVLKIGGSAWGTADFIRSWHLTSNALEGVATAHNDTLLCIDEIGQGDARKTGDSIYYLGNGSGKGRSRSNGSVSDLTTYRGVYVSTGEISLAEHMISAGKQVHGGQQARLPDIPIDAQSGMGIFETIHDAATPAEFAKRMVDNTSRYHGSAGVALLERLSDPVERQYALTIINKIKGAFVHSNVPQDSGGQIYRVANNFGFLAGVGEYCINSGILPFNEGDLLAAVTTCYNAYIDALGMDEVSEADMVISQVRANLMGIHGSLTLMDQINQTTDMGQITGVIRSSGDGPVEFLFRPDVYRDEICAGQNSQIVTDILKREGYLKVDTKGASPTNHRIPGHPAAMRFYVIKAAILRDEQGEGGQQEAA